MLFFFIIILLALLIIVCFKFNKKSIIGGNTNWFNSSHLKVLPNIKVSDLHGYVLPHAGTRFTGPIISHTLRFKSTAGYKKAIIFYYPVSENEDIVIEDGNGKSYYYHEYYVPWQSCLYLLDQDIEYIPFNARLNKIPPIEFSSDVLIIISSDFSHFYPFHTGFQLENKAAHALMHKFLQLPCTKIIDNYKTYEILFDYIPENYYLKWLGHDRSDTNVVGYMSFLLLSRPSIKKPFDGLFVTVYDAQMNVHECLGSWDKNIDEEKFIEHTVLSSKTSRLTEGKNSGAPIKFITITYLYKELNKDLSFIRGWHSISAHGAFYLSDVLLEYSYPNGNWIKETDIEWQTDGAFSLDDTFNSLKKKSNQFDSPCNLQLYYSEIRTITFF